jgi:TP901 family phage tail tape measure protein
MSVNVGTAVGYLDLDASKFKAGLKDAQSTLSEFTNQSNNAGTRFEALGSSLKTVGSTITTAVSLPLLALGAGAIKTASDFEAGMSKVSALSGATGDDLKMLEDKAREMGASTKYSATESAEALSYMALAGWDAEQMAAGLEPSLKLAGASGMDLALATDIVTDTMSMFGMEASEATKMTDMLAYAQANSNTDVQQLGEALKYCGASANAMGYDLADTTALLGTFADQGLKGSSAGTTLNAMFRDMKKNAKDGAIAIGDTNVAIVDANGNYRDMTDILADVEKATEGMTQAERDMALSSIWGTEALKGVNMAFEAGVPKIREFEDGIRKSDGAASEMYDTMQNNLQGAIDNMKSAFEGLLITIGQRLIPIFQSLVEGITNIFTWFNNLNPAIQNVIIGVGGFLAILGPLLLIVGNVIIFIVKLSTSISALVTFFGAGGAGAGLLSAAIGALSGPIGIAIAAITALIAVGVLLYNNWDTIKAKCSEVWNSIKETVNTVWNNIKTSTLGIWNNITSTLSSTWNAIKTVATTVWNAIKSVIQTVWNTIKSVVTTGANAVKSVVTTSFNAVKSVVTTIWNSIKTVIQTAWNGIKSVVSTGVNAVKSVITSVWSGLQEILIAPFRAAQSVISGILSGISSAISKVTSAISSVKNAASNVVDKINPFKKNIEISYSQEDINANARFRSDAIDLAKNLVYSDRTAKTSIAESISSVTKSASNMIKNKDVSSVKSGNSVVINNTYNSPKPASIRELKRQDEIQMRRLAMQLSF